MQLMMLNPILDNRVMGCIVVICETGYDYTQDDADILATLDRPSAIAH